MRTSLAHLAVVGILGAALLPAQVPTYTVRTVAGAMPPGDGGFALNAVLSSGMGKVTTDSAGNVYFAELVAGKVHRVGTDGVMTLIAGGGSGSTPALQATLSYPYSLAVDSVNNILYIGGLYSCLIQRVNLQTGAIATIAGTGTCTSSGPDGPALTTPLYEISGLALDSTGGLLFSEIYGYRVRRLDLTRATVTTIVGTGTIGAGMDGLPATQTSLSYTWDVALDSKGDIFVLDEGNCVVREIDAVTKIAHIVVGSLGKCGYAGEAVPPVLAQLDQADAIAVDAGGDAVYVAEGGGGSNRIRKANLAGNQINTIAGSATGGDSGDGGLAIQASITWPRGLALNSGGTLFFTEYVGARVRLIDTSQRSQAFAGVLNAATGDGGPALAAVLAPDMVASDGKGGFVIDDGGHHRVRAVSNGVISLVAGTNNFQGSTGDGGPATSAGLFVVYGMAVDPAGPVYISQGTGEVRVISGGNIQAVSSIAFNFPNGLALDPTRRFLYVAEYSGDRVVKVDVTTGQATTIAGIGAAGTTGASGDDGDNLVATQAHLNGPGQLAVDSTGNVYVVDGSNHVIRRINPSANTMVTVAGNHQVPASPAPDGGLATSASLNPTVITVDSNGNLFFGEGSRIRRVDAAALTLSTVAGTGVAGFSGDGGPALSAQLMGAGGINADAQGNIYFSDNNRIRVLSAPATKPRIDAPIVSANFGGGFVMASGTWMEIYGEDLSPVTRQWAGSDFNGNQAPSSLSNVQVLFNGKPGYIDVISPGQINAQVPDGIGTGNVSVQVVSPNGASDPVIVTAANRSPALLAPPSFTANGKFYAAGFLTDGSFVGPPNLIPGAQFRPAHTGETIVLYGIGFGAGTGVPSGMIAPPGATLTSVTVAVGGVNASVAYAAEAAGYVGLFQFNVVIPAGLSGDQILTISVNGVPSQQVSYLTIG
jgi:uncharacterized protein (TIGR03437 family)